ncbi:MAG TPA: CDP-alcohol phosphatidyltransferase family protein, partial [Chloroflexota bacterium]
MKIKYPGAAALEDWRSARLTGVSTRLKPARIGLDERDDHGLRPVVAAAGGEVVAHHPLLGAGGQGQARIGQRRRAVHSGPVAGLISQVMLLTALALTLGLGRTGWIVGLTSAVIMNGTFARGLSCYRSERLAPGDWVTLTRATLTIGVAALVADSFVQRVAITPLLSVAALALTLDAVDGWVARRTRTTATFGALFDGEVDAFLILVLSVYVARSHGLWVLAIGAARYAFLAAGWSLPWMRAPLPPRTWRKFAAATQGVVLTIAAADILPLVAGRALLIVALTLLAESFGRDVCWLWTHRAVVHQQAPAGAELGVDLRATAPADTRRGRVRASIGAGLTILAFLLVWAALVAPNQPQVLTLT